MTLPRPATPDDVTIVVVIPSMAENRAFVDRRLARSKRRGRRG